MFVEAVATLVVVLMVAFIKSLTSGYLHRLLKRIRRDRDANGEANKRIEDIHTTVHDIDQRTEEIECSQERMARAIVTIHEDDEDVNLGALRDRLDVTDLPGDITRDE